MSDNCPSKIHPLFNLWRMMRRRCEAKTHVAYKNYGGRGIHVCHEWKHFWTFVFDMGLPAPGLTLDRIDNNGPYAPWNCKWSSRTEQSQNSRSAVFVEFKGQRLCKSEWARRLGISNSSFDKRLSKYGMEKAVAMSEKSK